MKIVVRLYKSEFINQFYITQMYTVVLKRWILGQILDIQLWY